MPRKNVEFYEAMANNPELWSCRGHDLHTAAGVLRAKALDGMSKPDWSNLSPDDPGIADCLKYHGLLIQAAMLQGFAVECLLKCFWIAQGNTVAGDGEYKIEPIKRENHDLVKIAEAVGFALSESEIGALAKLSGFARSFGRYPIARKWQEQRLVKNEFGIDCGPSWNNEDHALAEGVLARSKSVIHVALAAKSGLDPV
ncbi:MAG TPA: hypothetical protein VND64_26315 [Pirellulales bacterium]|nr:hypothetical protein [Pirellulales bacterium]